MKKGATWVLMIALINCALAYSPQEHVDTDPTTVVYHTDEDNSVETVFELVAEEWLDIEDCVPNQDNGEDCDGNAKVKTLDWCPKPDDFHEPRLVRHKADYSVYSQPSLPVDDVRPATPPPDVA